LAYGISKSTNIKTRRNRNRATEKDRTTKEKEISAHEKREKKRGKEKQGSL
jgi:hypothetical protein